MPSVPLFWPLSCWGFLPARREGGFPRRPDPDSRRVGNLCPFFLARAGTHVLLCRSAGSSPGGREEGWESFILPTATLAFGPAVFHARLLDASLKETAEEDYVLFSRSKGLSEWQILIRHRLKPSLIPMLTSFGLTVGTMLGGTVIVENIFAWPGMGTLAVEAIFNRDYPMVQGYVLVMAAVYMGVNLFTDLLCARLDPRIRTGALHEGLFPRARKRKGLAGRGPFDYGGSDRGCGPGSRYLSP